MPTTEIQIGFHKLRALVIAAYDRGASLQGQELTFSHGNIGWDWIKLAEELDKLVSDCNATDKITIVKSEELEGLTKDIENVGVKVQSTMGEIRQIISVDRSIDIKERLLKLVSEAGRVQGLEDYIAKADNFRATVKAFLGCITMNDDQALDQIERLVKTKAIKKQQGSRKKKK